MPTPRRVLISHVTPGPVPLDRAAAHHLRDVLRLTTGDAVEAFDAHGATAAARIIQCDTSAVVLQIDQLDESAPPPRRCTIAAAVPKAQRADWMIEKLSELGVTTFIPLQADRSVVVPRGTQKSSRWERLAAEAARQSRRPGVMKIEPVMSVDQVLALCRQQQISAWYCSTAPGALAISTRLAQPVPDPLLVLIGPEGGWTDGELARLEQAGVLGVQLTTTILRIETAAVALAAHIACMPAATPPQAPSDAPRQPQ